MLKLRSLFPIGVLLAAATLFAQDVPPPPKAPAAPPPDPGAEPKFRLFGRRRTPATTPAPGATTPAPRQRATPAPKVEPTPAPIPKPKATPGPRIIPKRVPVATPLPVEGGEQNKRGFWDKVLGRKDKATPTPQAAKATPTPKPTRAKQRKDRPAPPAPQPEEAQPTKPAPEPKATPAPKPTRGAKPTPAPRESATVDEGADPETVEREKFTAAKAKAMEDTEIQELKLKADTAPTEEEARKAMRTYNKALFRKMRSIEPSIKDRIDATEAAIMRRLGE